MVHVIYFLFSSLLFTRACECTYDITIQPFCFLDRLFAGLNDADRSHAVRAARSVPAHVQSTKQAKQQRENKISGKQEPIAAEDGLTARGTRQRLARR
jgi:hypothetical protein